MVKKDQLKQVSLIKKVWRKWTINPQTKIKLADKIYNRREEDRAWRYMEYLDEKDN